MVPYVLKLFVDLNFRRQKHANSFTDAWVTNIIAHVFVK